MARPHPLLFEVARGSDVEPENVSLSVADSAIEHRMSGLLLSQLNGRIDRVPRDAAGALLAFDMAVTAQRQKQMEILHRVSEQLAGVEFALFKGPVSAARWFEQPTQRVFSDIDIVLSPRESLSVVVSMIDPGNASIPLLESEPRGVSSLILNVDGVRVDLQTEPLRMGIEPRNPERWWEETEMVDLPGIGDTRVFNAEADLALFLLHQARDRFRFLIGVAEGWRRFEALPNWERVESIARTEGLWDQLAVATACLCDELGIDCPIDIPSNWRADVWKRLWSEDVRLLGETGRIRYVRRATWLMPLLTRRRASDSLLWLIRAAVPTKEALTLRHPNASGPYLWRLISSRARIISRRRLWVWRHRHSSPQQSDADR